MILILIEIYAINRLINNLRGQNINVSKLFLIGLFLQSIILIAYRIDLNSLGREVYYSDAEVYWNHTLQLLNGQKIIGYGTQLGYAYFCAIIQFLSPFYSVIWNNISNILLIDLSILIIDLIFAKAEVIPANIQSFTKVCIYNPLIIYSLGRNLKDSLFLFITILIIYLYIQIKTNRKWIYIIPIVGLILFVSTVRPWGFLIMPLLVIDGFFSIEMGSLLKRIVLVVGIGIIFVIILRSTNLWNHVTIWEPVVMDNAAKLTTWEIIKAPVKILTGPGPYRALLGNKYFLFTTVTGNLFSAIGALIWWIVLSIYLCNMTCFRFRNNNMVFALVCIMFLLIYSMQYGGSLELRFRGIIYILFSAAFYSGLKERIRKKKTIVLVFMTIFPIGTLLSA